MIALAISALLGLYLFLPDFLFDRFAYVYVRLKKPQRTTPEDVFAGILAAAIPFVAAWILSLNSWYVGHYPFFIDEAVAIKNADYQTVLSGIISDSFLNLHLPDFWSASAHVIWHQARFLTWFYILLFVEIKIVVFLTTKYGEWKDNPFYRSTVGETIFRRASEWHVLLTPFAFPNKNLKIQVDVITNDGHLYQGNVGDHFVDTDGKLSGILLKDFKRFRFEALQDHRKRGFEREVNSYWRNIPGANFYIPGEKIMTLNIRYELSKPDLFATLQETVNKLIREHKFKIKVSQPEHPSDPSHPSGSSAASA